MNQKLIYLLLLLMVGASHASSKSTPTKPPLICSGDRPVKLFVGFVVNEKKTSVMTFGSAFVCFDKMVDSDEDLVRLNYMFNDGPRKESVTTVLSVSKVN